MDAEQFGMLMELLESVGDNTKSVVIIYFVLEFLRCIVAPTVWLVIFGMLLSTGRRIVEWCVIKKQQVENPDNGPAC